MTDALVPLSAGGGLLQSWLRMTIEQRRALILEHDLPLKWVELPIDLETFIRSPDYLNHPPLSELQFDFVYHASELFDLEAWDPTKVVFRPGQMTEFVLVWGKSGGKKICTMIAFARVLYLLGCLTSPHEVFGRPVYESFDLLDIAVSGEQAERTFFNSFKRMLAGSPWFMKRLGIVMRADAICVPPIIGQDKNDVDMYSVNCWRGTSAVGSLEGLHLLMVVIDEIDEFRTQGKMLPSPSLTAEGMYEAMRLSSQSRFPGLGKIILTSWPRHANSFIMRKLNAGKEDDTVYTSGPFAVWDVNPTSKEEDFADEFRRNPEVAAARLAAQPQRNLEGYFTNTAAVLSTFHAEQTEELKIVRSEEDPGREAPVNWDTMQLIPALIGKPNRRLTYCWHGDLAVSKCRAGLAMAHHSGWVKDLDDELVPVITLDLAYWWEAPEGKEIDFAEIRKFILSVARLGYRTAVVSFDQFGSIFITQQLRRFDQFGRRLRFDRDGNPMRPPIKVDRLSVDRDTQVYDTLKELCYADGRLDAFYCPLLVEELLGLVTIVRGSRLKVDHLEGATKDVSDAVAGAVFNAVQNLNDSVGVRRAASGKAIVGARRGGQWDVDDEAVSIRPTPGTMPKVFG
jgi:hypothetical protein